MSWFVARSWGYKALLDDKDIDEQEHGFEVSKRTQERRTLLWILTFIGFAAGMTVGFLLQDKALFHKLSEESSVVADHCHGLATRREWRSLSNEQKEDYTKAVQCLARLPSKLRDNGTLYDDFPWVHRHFGALSHGAALFLPWHRYFIHLYEKALREDCGYQGHLAYWDWSLDWVNLSHSPIWDSEFGFGGDGDPNGVETVGSGRCVINGPFAGLRPIFYNKEDDPHCLSRGFWDGHEKGLLPGAGVSPQVIEQILAQPDYESFFLALEHGPHNVIPNSVRGDFLKFTAPSDPVFFLHHTQLDRLWWRWQRRNSLQRSREYSGKSTSESTVRAQLSDILPMGQLGPDIPVEQVMVSQSDMLCYLY